MPTRPKPTIYGNCDSWSFIVGKKPGAYRRKGRQTGSLQTSNRHIIHRLLTKLVGKLWDKLWAICGSPVHPVCGFRMMVASRSDMP